MKCDSACDFWTPLRPGAEALLSAHPAELAPSFAGAHPPLSHGAQPLLGFSSAQAVLLQM